MHSESFKRSIKIILGFTSKVSICSSEKQPCGKDIRILMSLPNLTHSVTVFSSSWGTLGTTMGSFGASLGPFGSTLGPLWVLLGPLWVHHGFLWNLLGPLWVHHGFVWNLPGPIWGFPGPLLGPFGVIGSTSFP
jgi:hypothetical protein